MNLSLRIALIVALIFYFGCIYMMLKTKKLVLKYSLLWLFAGCLMIVAVVFPQILEWIAKRIGIINYLNGLFATILFGLLILLMYLTMVVSELSSRNRTLIQECALMEKRIRKLEEQVGGKN